MDRDLLRRAQRHAALGEPIRLAIVEALQDSDRAPSELAARFAIPTNLLAHHLETLELAGLIERRPSSGDGRRRYVRLMPSATAELGLRYPRPNGHALFVCTHSSARSQLAAALWRHRTGQPATSAGTHPAARVHPGAVAAARRAHLDLNDATPRALRPEDTDGATLVITVCDRAHEELDPRPEWLHWSVADPVASGAPAAFDAALDELDHRITALI